MDMRDRTVAAIPATRRVFPFPRRILEIGGIKVAKLLDQCPGQVSTIGTGLWPAARGSCSIEARKRRTLVGLLGIISILLGSRLFGAVRNRTKPLPVDIALAPRINKALRKELERVGDRRPLGVVVKTKDAEATTRHLEVVSSQGVSLSFELLPMLNVVILSASKETIENLASREEVVSVVLNEKFTLPPVRSAG